MKLGGLDSSILPRSALYRSVLDPALPEAVLSGDRYEGWRVDARVPFIPFGVFYHAHRVDSTQLALVGGQLTFHSAPNPILKLPALDVTLGVAYGLDAPIEDETKWWLGMTWRP